MSYLKLNSISSTQSKKLQILCVIKYTHQILSHSYLNRHINTSNALLTLVELEFTNLVKVGLLKFALVILISIVYSAKTNPNDDENNQVTIHEGILGNYGRK